MTPLGYLRKVEHLMVAFRDEQPTHVDSAAEAVDQAWGELARVDQLMVYNIARSIMDNVQLKQDPQIILTH